MTRKLYAQQNRYPNLSGWTAYIDGEDDMGPDNLVGFGSTAEEAIEDLRMILKEAEDATIEANFGVLAQGWATKAHADRATLLRAVDRLSAELAAERARRVEVEGAMINLNTAIDKMWNDTDGRVVSERHSLRITHAQRAAAATITKDTP